MRRGTKKLIGVMVSPETHDAVMKLVEAEKEHRPRACKSSVCRRLVKFALRNMPHAEAIASDEEE